MTTKIGKNCVFSLVIFWCHVFIFIFMCTCSLTFFLCLLIGYIKVTIEIVVDVRLFTDIIDYDYTASVCSVCLTQTFDIFPENGMILLHAKVYFYKELCCQHGQKDTPVVATYDKWKNKECEIKKEAEGGLIMEAQILQSESELFRFSIPSKRKSHTLSLWVLCEMAFCFSKQPLCLPVATRAQTYVYHIGQLFICFEPIVVIYFFFSFCHCNGI